MENRYIIDESNSGKRIDVVVSDLEEKISRSIAQSLIKDGKILLDSKVVKTSQKVQLGQELLIPTQIEETTEIKPENIDLDIIYEDEDIIVINKPKDMVVHPALGNRTGTLVNAILGKTELSMITC